MVLTLDTLVLVNCGAATNNKQLLGEARSMYSLALASLRSELASPTPEGGYFNSLLGVHMLQCCELFDFLAVNRDSWRRHVSGLHAIMANTTPKERQASAEQAGWVLAKTIRVPFGLWNALVRERGQAPIKKFTANSIQKLRKDDPDNSLLLYGLVPSVLQRGDAIILQGRNASAEAVSGLLTELIATEGALHQNLTEAYCKVEQKTYHQLPMDNLAASVISFHLGPHVFGHALAFPDLLTALEHIYYWMSLLSLQRTHLRVKASVSKRAYPFEYQYCGFDDETLISSANEYADQMCMTLPYMCLPERGYIGMICAIAPLQLAAQWYKQSQNWAKLKWCRAAGAAIQSKGLAEFDLC
ncbi:hypothetical protein HII31_06908 [Pseudocercospora fuligena]|uniref:Uncharacterized protein n=1 Tax=Pseudocercospora fuligena TaxID=685502 RepID=A0A8H6VGV0_9PEZI|nr:hypothetical protein HII31_06908 [Pseudocercospora fuligena]